MVAVVEIFVMATGVTAWERASAAHRKVAEVDRVLAFAGGIPLAIIAAASIAYGSWRFARWVATGR